MTNLKSLGIILVLLIFPIFTYSQYFNGGVKIGFTGSQIDGDELGGYNKPGLTAGVFINREINYKFYWQTELYYIMKGAAKLTKAEDPDLYRMALHYAEVPFFLTYKLSPKLEAQAGPALGYLWYGTRNTGAGKEELKTQIDKFDFSGIIGFHYLLSDHFSFVLRLSHSITSISREPGNLTWFGTYGQYNHQLELSLFYTLNKK